MRPRALRRRLALVGFGGMLICGLATAGLAKADPVDNYTVAAASTICDIFDNSPTLATVSGLFAAIETDTGWGTDAAARVIVDSVAVYCPRNWGVLNRFVAVYGDSAHQVIA